VVLRAYGYRVKEVANMMPAPKHVSDIKINVSNHGVIPRRIVAEKLPFGPQCYVPCCPDPDDQLNQLTGLQQRLGRELPEPSVDLRFEFGEFVKRYLEKFVTPLLSIMSFTEWLESTTYNQARKEQLKRIWEKIHDATHIQKKFRHIVNSFIKLESYGIFKFPRWINSRSDYFKVCAGPFFKSIEKAIYENHHYIKHVPVSERRHHIIRLRSAGRQYYSTDYKAFESHFTPDFMEICELQLYRHMCGNVDGPLTEMICKAISGTNVGHTRSGVSFVLDGRRMSGDMCTSLGNGFSNLMLWLFMCEKLGVETDGFVEGDDGIFATWGAETNSKMFQDFAEQLGFTIDIIPHADPCLAGFCGMIFADDANIKDPRDILDTFGWTFSHINCTYKVKMQLLKAKALSLCYELPQCPIIGAISRRAIELTSDYHPRFVYDGYHDYSNIPETMQAFEPSISTRELFSELYGVSPNLQIELEKTILSGSDDALDCLVETFPLGVERATMQSYYSIT